MGDRKEGGRFALNALFLGGKQSWLSVLLLGHRI